MRIVILTFIMLSINLVNAFAADDDADTLRLTLDTCLRMAFERGLNMELTRLDSLETEAEWNVIKGLKYPQLRLSGDTPDWFESIEEQWVFDPDNDREVLQQVPSSDQRWQSRFELGQQLPWGASLKLSTRFYKRHWYYTLLDSQETFDEYSLVNRISVEQPLLAGNPVKRNFNLGRLNHETGRINYEIDRRRMIYETTRAFFNLVSAVGALDISRQDLQKGQASEKLAERKINAGLIPEVELLQIQVDLARREANYRQSQDEVQSATDELSQVLNIPYDVKILPEFQFQMSRRDDGINIDHTLDRLEYRLAELDLDRSELTTRSAILAERINATLQLYYEVDTRRENISDLDQGGERNIGVMLHFELPIYGFGTTRNSTEAMRVNLKRKRIDLEIRERNLLTELRAAIRNVQRTTDRIDIAISAVELSQRSHDITSERFEKGLVDSRALLDSQLELTRTMREALEAQIEYELALAYLNRIAPG